jgi:hypothetical protein
MTAEREIIGRKAAMKVTQVPSDCSFMLASNAIRRCAAITLLALAWSGLAFCGEIHDAARSGDVEKVTTLLKGNPALVSSQDTNGWTALLWAAAEGYEDLAELLLSKKAKVNAKDKAGLTPLHWASQNGKKDMVALLPMVTKLRWMDESGGFLK